MSRYCRIFLRTISKSMLFLFNIIEYRNSNRIPLLSGKSPLQSTRLHSTPSLFTINPNSTHSSMQTFAHTNQTNKKKNMLTACSDCSINSPNQQKSKPTSYLFIVCCWFLSARVSVRSDKSFVCFQFIFYRLVLCLILEAVSVDLANTAVSGIARHSHKWSVRTADISFFLFRVFRPATSREFGGVGWPRAAAGVTKVPISQKCINNEWAGTHGNDRQGIAGYAHHASDQRAIKTCGTRENKNRNAHWISSECYLFSSGHEWQECHSPHTHTHKFRWSTWRIYTSWLYSGT